MGFRDKVGKQQDFYDKLLIGNQIAEVIKLLLEKSGYLVIPYGYDSTHPSLCKKIREEGIEETRTVLRIRCSPDLLVYDDKNKKLILVEVKMRKPRTVDQVWISGRMVSMYQQFWDDAILVMVIDKDDIFYAQEICNLDPSKKNYDVRIDFRRIEEMFERVQAKDLSNFKNKALEIMKRKTFSMDQVRKKYPKAYEKWTSEEDKLLRKEFQEGLTNSEIAKLHQRKSGAIHARLKKLGLIS